MQRIVLVQVVLIALGIVDSASGQSASLDGLPFEVDEYHVFGFDSTGIGTPSDAVLDRDGSLVVADLQAGTLTRLSPSGQIVSSFGGKGDGPGEFHYLYKVAVDSARNIHAYDLGGSQISVFSPAGDFQDRIPLDLSFRQVDDLRVLDSGRYVLSGMASYPGNLVNHAIHTFSPAGEYLASFGPLPRADSVEVLNFWGVGNIAITPAGNILFGRRLPYEFYEFTPDGRSVRTFAPGIELKGKPDDAYVIERSAGRFRISFSETHVDRPLRPIVFNSGQVLTGRITEHTRWWDILNAQGSIEHSFRVPESWGGLLGVDSERKAIWIVKDPGLTNSIARLKLDGQLEEGGKR